MKKEITHKQIDQSVDDMLKKEGTTYEIPINLDDIEFGNIKINFEYKRQKISLDKKKKKRFLLMVLLDKLEFLSAFSKILIEFELNLIEKYKVQILDFGALSLWLGPSTDPFESRSYLGNFIYHSRENNIFDLIKSEGPLLLCNEFVQEKIHEWLLDKDKAGEKLDKIKNSLLKITHGPLLKDKLLKLGRPKSDVKKIGKAEVVDRYRKLCAVLSIIKKEKEFYREAFAYDDIARIIDHAGRSFLVSIKKHAEENRIFEVSGYIEEIFKYNLFYPISKIIESDEDLKTEFASFRWEPNKLAKEILAKLLTIKISTIENILYRDKTKIPPGFSFPP